MRIEQLEHLAAVTRHGSFRRASEHVHLSQPALSESVRNLERELGVQLLERRRTGTRVTPDGERLLRPVMEVIDAARRLRLAADVPGPAAPLRVAVTYVDTGGVAIDALRSLAGTGEPRALEIVPLGTAAQAIAALDAELDACLLLHVATEQEPTGLEAVEVWRGGVDVLMRGDCSLATQQKVSVAELADRPLVSALPLGSLPLETAWRCGQDAVAEGAVRAGVGIALVPALPRHGDSTLVARPLADGPTLALTLLRSP
ncbi:LysR family transcriptional regulator [Nocardioides daejeonensis]|uniref:LysR family transcriptional regulator n=1 Tax=Nocardioides daejeonensis TaxID=1046556 RepID=UPI0019503FAF|nr:LysR family transcriptional regulator [Nocardioides daejeonensis]